MSSVVQVLLAKTSLSLLQASQSKPKACPEKQKLQGQYIHKRHEPMEGRECMKNFDITKVWQKKSFRVNERNTRKKICSVNTNTQPSILVGCVYLVRIQQWNM